MLRIPRTKHVLNEEVLRGRETTKKLLLTIRKQQIKFGGHLMRKGLGNLKITRHDKQEIDERE